MRKPIAAFLLLVAPALLSACTQQSKEQHIVMVLPSTRSSGPIEEAFQEHLASRRINARYTVLPSNTYDPSSFPALVKEIRRAKPDLVYTWGTPTTLGIVGRYDAKDTSNLLRNVPVVFASVVDPRAAAIAQNLERPGGNVTGATHIAPTGDQLDAMNSYRKLRTLGLVYTPHEPNAIAMLESLEVETQRRGIALLKEMVPDDAQGKPDQSKLAELVRRLKTRGADWLYLGPDTFVSGTHQGVILETAYEIKLPVFSAIESAVHRSKALFGVYAERADVGRLAGHKAAQVLQEGKSPGVISIGPPSEFTMMINLSMAEYLGMYPPQETLNVSKTTSHDVSGPAGSAFSDPGRSKAPSR